jgi:putative tryptophan/tyrosine transport system substrate-binding protein
MENFRIRRAGFLNRNSPQRHTSKKVFSGPVAKNVFQQYRPKADIVSSTLLLCSLARNPISSVANCCFNHRTVGANPEPEGKVRRRDFITLLGGATSWPLTARAQQSAIPVVGFLSARSANESASVVTGFRQGLAENGYVDGRNVAIEYRWAEGQYDRLTALAMELLRVPVALIVAVGGDPAARAAKSATTTIPVVANFSDDPVASGLVTSLGRPGGNITGTSNLSTEMESKRFGLLRAVVPQAAIIGVLLNPTFPSTPNQLREMQEAARTLGLQVIVMQASNESDIDASFASLVQHRADALLVGNDPFFLMSRDQLTSLAARYSMPAIYSFPEFPAAGGLMSYGIDLTDSYRQIGNYAGQILKGAKPADLPVLQPSKFMFVVNLKTAKSLGLKIDPQLLATASELIE